jgi:hypothetical protein
VPHLLFTYERAFTALKVSEQRPVVLIVKARACGSEAGRQRAGTVRGLMAVCSGGKEFVSGGQHYDEILPALGRLFWVKDLKLSCGRRVAGGIQQNVTTTCTAVWLR